MKQGREEGRTGRGWPWQLMTRPPTAGNRTRDTSRAVALHCIHSHPRCIQPERYTFHLTQPPLYKHLRRPQTRPTIPKPRDEAPAVRALPAALRCPSSVDCGAERAADPQPRGARGQSRQHQCRARLRRTKNAAASRMLTFGKVPGVPNAMMSLSA